MWLKLRIYNVRLFGNISLLTIILCWILQHSPLALGRPTKYDSRRQYPTPSFSSSSGNVSFYLGSTANLSCVIDNLGARTVIWRKLPNESPITIGESLFKNDSRISISHDSSRNNWDLIIKNVKFDDSGEYECQVPSTNKNIRQHIFLRITEPPFEEKTDPPPVISIAGPKLTHVGDKLIIQCSATYTGVASIDWFFNGHLMESNTDSGIRVKERFSGVSKTIHSTLEIDNVDMKNSGIYTCRSADEYVTDYRVTVLSDVKTNNKKRDRLDSDSSTSSQISNNSTRVCVSHPVIFLFVVTWYTGSFL